MKIVINGVDVTNDCVVKNDTIIFCGGHWPPESLPSTGEDVQTPPASVGDNWIKIEDRLPEKPEDGNESEKWKLCCTEFGAVLLSLCYYEHNTKRWYDAHNPTPEERVAYWKQPTPPTK